MNQDFPKLQQFLAGYFNQDWVDDHESANDVIAFFISEADSDTTTKLQAELDRLIHSRKTEQELEIHLFKDIGCYYCYCNEWKDGRTWLKHIVSILKHSERSRQT
ncbi:contact-dependent growth inhibition system immunity protein [Pseudomonas pergaminensis]